MIQITQRIDDVFQHENPPEIILASFSDSKMIATSACVDDIGQTYFPFNKVNADAISHFRELGKGFISLEDFYVGNDNDFDDFILN